MSFYGFAACEKMLISQRERNFWRPLLAPSPLTYGPMSDKKKRSVLSLFSGCGGMDIGFEGGFPVHRNSIGKHHGDWVHSPVNKDWVRVKPTSFSTVFANDIIPESRTVWSEYFNDKRGERFHLRSIIDLVKEHRAEGGVFPSGVDVVTGGFPCQDFSVAGLRKGFNSHKSHTGKIREDDEVSAENRGLLYFWMREVIDITRPKMFIAENVKGLVSLGDAKDVIQRDFASTGGDGYVVLPPRVLHAAEYGVPQRRERVFFIGFRKSALRKAVLDRFLEGDVPEELSPFPAQTHVFAQSGRSPIPMNGFLPHVTISDIFSDLREPTEEKSDPAQQVYSKAKWMGRHCQGQTEIKLDSVGPTIRSEHHGNIEFRRLLAEHGGVIKNELKRGLGERRLTVRECARIQTFPDDMRFVGKFEGSAGPKSVSASVAYKLIGNAVPPFLAYNIARRLDDIWDSVFKG